LGNSIKRRKKMGIWDDLYHDGERLGFKKGGAVKKMGKMKTSKQDSMDQPAKKGTSQQEIEAGGTPKLRPGYKGGGKAKKGKEKMAEKGAKRLARAKKGYQKGGEVEVEVVVGNKTTRKSNSGSINKKEMKKGGKTGKKKYARGGSIKVHNSEPLIGK
jgi:hypothetical protein